MRSWKFFVFQVSCWFCQPSCHTIKSLLEPIHVRWYCASNIHWMLFFWKCTSCTPKLRKIIELFAGQKPKYALVTCSKMSPTDSLYGQKILRSSREQAWLNSGPSVYRFESALLYSRETWTYFERYLKLLEQIHQKCLPCI